MSLVQVSCDPLLWSSRLHTGVSYLGMLSQLNFVLDSCLARWCADVFMPQRVSSARRLLQTPVDDLLIPCPCAPNIFTGHGKSEAASFQRACWLSTFCSVIDSSTQENKVYMSICHAGVGPVCRPVPCPLHNEFTIIPVPAPAPAPLGATAVAIGPGDSQLHRDSVHLRA